MVLNFRRPFCSGKLFFLVGILCLKKVVCNMKKGVTIHLLLCIKRTDVRKKNRFALTSPDNPLYNNLVVLHDETGFL